MSDYFLFPELNKHISIYTDVYTARSLRPKNAHSCALTWPFDPLIKNMKKHRKNLHFYTHPHVTGQERNENSLGTHRSAFRGRQMTTSMGRETRGVIIFDTPRGLAVHILNANSIVTLEIKILVALAHSRSQLRTTSDPGKFQNNISHLRHTTGPRRRAGHWRRGRERPCRPTGD